MTLTNPPESNRDAKHALALAAEQIRADSRRGYEQLVQALRQEHRAALERLQGADSGSVFVFQGEARAVAALLKAVENCEKTATEINKRRS